MHTECAGRNFRPAHLKENSSDRGITDMQVLVIDGQGGNIGKQLIKMIREELPGISVIAVGTNSLATQNMIKAGAENAATGENAVVVNSRRADIIVGPIGIVVADALFGEVTAKMAEAVGSSSAVRILIPLNRCDTLVAGVNTQSTAALLEDAMKKIKEAAKEE